MDTSTNEQFRVLKLKLTLLACKYNNNCQQNDTYGHNIGDEFCIILPETDQQGAYQIAKRILSGAETISLSKAVDLQITLSIGAAEYKEEFVKIEDWINSADNALYQVKKEGRKGVHFSSDCVVPDYQENDILTRDPALLTDYFKTIN